MVVILPGFLAQSTVGPILTSRPRIRSVRRVTNSVLKTQEKKMSGSELEPRTKATQSSRREDMPIDFIELRGTALSIAMLS